MCEAQHVASNLPSFSSLRNRPPQPSDTRAAQSSSGYRSDYDQYSQYQQMYPGYYPSWGYDQSGYAYGQMYDYSQYPASQVGPAGLGSALHVHTRSHSLFLGRRVRPFLMMDSKVGTGSASDSSYDISKSWTLDWWMSGCDGDVEQMITELLCCRAHGGAGRGGDQPEVHGAE